jgi:predicted peptidase
MMKRVSQLISIFVVMLFSHAVFAQQLRTIGERERILVAKVFRNKRGERLPYRLLIPSHYDSKKKYPLVLYLHGGGGVGKDNRKQIDGGNGYLVDLFTGSETQMRYPSFVVAPQAPETEGWINQDLITPTRQLRLVYEMLGELQRIYSIDSARCMSRDNRWAALALLRSFRSTQRCSPPAYLCAAAAINQKSRGCFSLRSSAATISERSPGS